MASVRVIRSSRSPDLPNPPSGLWSVVCCAQIVNAVKAIHREVCSSVRYGRSIGGPIGDLQESHEYDDTQGNSSLYFVRFPAGSG